MTIATILNHKGEAVETIAQNAAVSDAARQLADRRIGALVVLDEAGEIAGICSERDIVAATGHEGAPCLDWPIERIMKSPAITVTPEDTIDSSLALMSERRIRHLPVVREGRLSGIVSIGDLVKSRIDLIEEEANAMRDYITTA